MKKKVKKKVVKKVTKKKVVVNKGKKKVVKKKKAVAKKTVSKTEIVVRVETNNQIPSTQELSEPMRNGQKLTLPKTWLAENQLTQMLQRTPAQYIYRRKGKGNMMFDYVTGSYIQKVLNFVFAWNWDFEVVEHGKENNHVWVLGRLTVHGTKEGQKIVKTQFGRADVKQLKSGGNVDYGNDLKAASTDALKKCASMLGIASDVYGKADYKAESGNEPVDRAPQAPETPPVSKEGEEVVVEYEADTVCQGLTKVGCGGTITPQEKVYSIKMFKKELCRKCQKVA